eukprot:TRINITY_DN1523_c0_g1_i1.p1 TRINITY_DN1523_c0_g1~~TRINITY_DN1523_c0_g1_i1.p1  ORF type:complete len:677 (-),score=121.97 TRINITY_DN1523_c0_g1_i1:107-2137(-)
MCIRDRSYTPEQFELELKEKLSQRTTHRLTEEGVLLKNFKYFDLNESGTVDYKEFIRALEKTGVVISDEQNMRALFNHYDLDNDGQLDYKEFANIVSRAIQQNRPSTTQSQRDQRSNFSQFGSPKIGHKSEQIYAPMDDSHLRSYLESLFQRIRSKLSQRGCRVFINLERVFRLADVTGTEQLGPEDFFKILRDQRIELTEQDNMILLNKYIDQNSGKVQYYNFFFDMLGQVNNFRKQLHNQVFNKIDNDGDNILTIDELKGNFYPGNHPEIKSGKRTQEDVYQNFMESLETHHYIRLGQRDIRQTREEFQEFMQIYSASVDDDALYEAILNNVFKLQSEKNYADVFAGQAGGRRDYKPGSRHGYMNDHHKHILFGGSVAQYAPFGTLQTPTEYSTAQRPQSGFTQSPQKPVQQYSPAGQSTWGNPPSAPNTSKQLSSPWQQPQQQQGQFQSQGVGQQQSYKQSPSDNLLLKALQEKVKQRGSRGIFSLGKLFGIIDDDESKELDLTEFSKALRDFRVEMEPSEIQRLFNIFDRDRSGKLSYDEFLRCIRGDMNDFRKGFVRRAFDKLDKNRNGVVTLDDLIGVYDGTKHPEVIKGKKTQDEILGEFLDTFEQHHAIKTNDFRLKDRTVTFEEFLEYYENISCSIDDDKYFEVMITNAWDLDNQKQKFNRAAWRNY